ncbi:hypothetical protein FisN_3Hu607 [Fistulifera solaris]|uniref:Chitinase n=1 Tax=Fistulifera solaris TaxID=1519565 RepID=A0A1Z5K2R7_FISSO|nr:hypothetical protein FisN_3Hu607 [Fistulifera solaris]|eukprot:GAX20543.1 hypothetical protein FisN_3Hu607 [Fistulifera solaris]
MQSPLWKPCFLVNQDISDWDTEKVTSMSAMFTNALAFNQDIADWDTASANSMTYMFFNAPTFDQHLCAWKDVATGALKTHWHKLRSAKYSLERLLL